MFLLINKSNSRIFVRAILGVGGERQGRVPTACPAVWALPPAAGGSCCAVAPAGVGTNPVLPSTVSTAPGPSAGGEAPGAPGSCQASESPLAGEK